MAATSHRLYYTNSSGVTKDVILYDRTNGMTDGYLPVNIDGKTYYAALKKDKVTDLRILTPGNVVKYVQQKGLPEISQTTFCPQDRSEEQTWDTFSLDRSESFTVSFSSGGNFSATITGSIVGPNSISRHRLNYVYPNPSNDEWNHTGVRPDESWPKDCMDGAMTVAELFARTGWERSSDQYAREMGHYYASYTGVRLVTALGTPKWICVPNGMPHMPNEFFIKQYNYTEQFTLTDEEAGNGTPLTMTYFVKTQDGQRHHNDGHTHFTNMKIELKVLES